MDRPVFVVPHYSSTVESWGFLGATVDSLLAQTDTAWDAVIVDDCSDRADRHHALQSICHRDTDRLHYVALDEKLGPGGARNVGVNWAAERGAPFVLFLDADDLAHPNRLRRTRDCLDEQPDVAFVYSSFVVVDEHDVPKPRAEVTPSIREILAVHEGRAVRGSDVWRQVALETGYTTPSNTVAVRTWLALRHPFPRTYVSEDAHTWLRMLASGVSVEFLADIPSRRRVPSWVSGSSSRERYGDDFYWIKLLVDLDGFLRATDIARAQHPIEDSELVELRRSFYQRQARTMAAEGRHTAAEMCEELARNLPVGSNDGAGSPAEGLRPLS